MQEYHTGYNLYPYIFIQFSHDDADRVLPIIRKLKAENYNIVYDENFEKDDKKRYLGIQQIAQASSFILFYSRSAAKSRLIKETVRFAGPIYNMEKYCICLDDTKFGFSFSDIKNNYIIIEETELNSLMKILENNLNMYILPEGVSPYGTFDELTESSEPDELEEIDEYSFLDKSDRHSDETEEVTGLSEPEKPLVPEDKTKEQNFDYIFKDVLEELVTEDDSAPYFSKSRELAEFLRTDDKPDIPNASNITADSPEAFPDFDMSDDFGDDEDYEIPTLSGNTASIPGSLPRFSASGAEKRVSNPEPVQLQEIKPKAQPASEKEPVKKAKPEAQPASQKKHADESAPVIDDSELLWNTLRKKMHVRAAKNARLFAKSYGTRTLPYESGDYSEHAVTQDDTIESITIEYPTDEDVPELTVTPQPIIVSRKKPRITATPETDLNEISHKPEPAQPRIQSESHSTMEYTPLFTDNPPPSEVLPLPINEPQIEIGTPFSAGAVTDSQDEYPTEEAEYNQNSGQTDESSAQDTSEEYRITEDYPEQYKDEDFEEESEPEPEPELNSYEYFTQNVLSEMDSDSMWNGESFFAETETEPEPKSAFEPEPERPVNFLGGIVSETGFSEISAVTEADSETDEDEEFRSYEEFIQSSEKKKDETPQQIDIKTQILIKAAEQGNADAQYKLGLSYEHGERLEQNYVKAAHWYILSSNRGNANAQYNLANMYEHGLGVSRNVYEAADLYKAAAEQGHSNAQTQYGLCLKNGVGTDREPAEAVKWFVKASEKGNAAAIFHLGACFESGIGVDKDLSHALQLYLASANQNYSEAQNALANCYMSGKGVPANYTEAVRWYSKAARGGSVAAQFNIGFCCENGLGIDKNPDMAYRFYRIAADNGSESATKRLKELGFINDMSDASI